MAILPVEAFDQRQAHGEFLHRAANDLFGADIAELLVKRMQLVGIQSDPFFLRQNPDLIHVLHLWLLTTLSVAYAGHVFSKRFAVSA